MGTPCAGIIRIRCARSDGLPRDEFHVQGAGVREGMISAGNAPGTPARAATIADGRRARKPGCQGPQRRAGRRYWSASATCAAAISSAPSRSATVRATLSSRW